MRGRICMGIRLAEPTLLWSRPSAQETLYSPTTTASTVGRRGRSNSTFATRPSAARGCGCFVPTRRRLRARRLLQGSAIGARSRGTRSWAPTKPCCCLNMQNSAERATKRARPMPTQSRRWMMTPAEPPDPAMSQHGSRAGHCTPKVGSIRCFPAGAKWRVDGASAVSARQTSFVNRFPGSARGGGSMKVILCVHQGTEGYGSDKSFVAAVAAIDRQDGLAATVLLPGEGKIIGLLARGRGTEGYRPVRSGRAAQGRACQSDDRGYAGQSGRPLACQTRDLRRYDLVYVNTAVIFDFLLASISLPPSSFRPCP